MNRLTVRNFATLEKGPVGLFARITFAGTGGTPTLDAANSKGILAVTRTGTGAYTIKFGGAAGVDTFQRILAADHLVSSTGSSVCKMILVTDDSASKTAPAAKVAFLDFAGLALELANTEEIRFMFVLSNSTAA
jgi:hypothetical protein